MSLDEGRMVAVMRYYLYMLTHAPWLLLGNEWSERWAAWPHCNGQAGCWMHYGPSTRWCRCRCRWCDLARLIRPRAANPRSPSAGMTSRGRQ